MVERKPDTMDHRSVLASDFTRRGLLFLRIWNILDYFNGGVQKQLICFDFFADLKPQSAYLNHIISIYKAGRKALTLAMLPEKSRP